VHRRHNADGGVICYWGAPAQLIGSEYSLPPPPNSTRGAGATVGRSTCLVTCAERRSSRLTERGVRTTFLGDWEWTLHRQT